MKNTIYFFFLLISCTITNAQVYNQQVAEYIKQVESPYNFLNKFEQLGIKMSGTSGIDSTYLWLNEISKNLGYNPIINKFINDGDSLVNIELLKKGDNDSCILVCAHYDSWVGKGVNDNGTGCFAVYQLSKLMKSLKTKYSIRFIYFSGEELGYKGSYHYVSKIKTNNIKVKYMINLDQLGGTVGESNHKVYCERDNKTSMKNESMKLSTAISNCISLYTTITPEIGEAYLSDYIPFIDSSYVISGLYQYATYPYNHTADDLLKNVELNSLKEIVKGALTSLLFLSDVDNSELSLNKEIHREINVYFSENGMCFKDLEGYNYEIIDMLGKVLKKGNISENYQIIPIKSMHNRICIIHLNKGLKYYSKKIFLHY